MSGLGSTFESLHKSKGKGAEHIILEIGSPNS
jgi:hypothetical protein